MSPPLEPALIADAIVNILGAAGVAAVATDAHRADPRGPVTRRVVAALALVGTIFLARGLAWWTGSPLLHETATLLAAAVPLAALVVAEGLLRRHAPPSLKVTVTAGIAGVTLAALLLPSIMRDALLLALQVFALGAIGLLLWKRDQSALSSFENRSIRNVALGLAVVVPAVITDFRFLMPDVPVRMGAFGVLLALYLGFGAGGKATSRDRLWSQLAFLAVAAALAFAYVSAAAEPSAAAAARAFVVACSGLIVAALVSESLGARAERNRPADPLLAASTTVEFEARLKDHPLLRDAVRIEESDLAHLRHPAFTSLLADHAALRLGEAPWGRVPEDAGVERARSLMSAYDATHAFRLSIEPLRLVLVAVPAVSADRGAENELGLAFRIAELLYAREKRQ